MRRLDAEADERARSGARRREAARRVHPARRLPAHALDGRDPLVRRPPGARRQAPGRRHPRVQPVHPHADLAAADDRACSSRRRHARRPGAGPGARDPGHRPGDRRPPGAVALPPGPGDGDVRGRALRVRARSRGARRARPDDPRRRGGRARRCDRERQDDGRAAAPALLRRRGRPDAARRRRRARHRGATTCAKSIGIVFEDTFLFSDTVRENIAFADPEASLDAGPPRGAARPGAEAFIDALPDGYDTRDRRARLLAVGRAAPAHRDRPRGARRPAGADPRRRDVVGRPHQGARDPRRARRGDGRAGRRSSSPTGRRRSRSPTAWCCSATASSSPKARTRSCSRPRSGTGRCSPPRTSPGPTAVEGARA